MIAKGTRDGKKRLNVIAKVFSRAALPPAVERGWHFTWVVHLQWKNALKCTNRALGKNRAIESGWVCYD